MAGPVPLLFLGDSITFGWLNTPLWDSLYGSRGAENFGINGDHVEHLLWRIRRGELGRIEPAAVVLLIGTNNIGLDAPEAIAEGIAAVVAEIRRRSPRTQILLLGLLPRGLAPRHGQLPVSETPDPRIAAVNRLIAPLGNQARVTYLDFGDRLLGPDGRIDHAIQPDCLHLSVRGYVIWADAIGPILDSLTGAVPGHAPSRF
jgi:lysophospholipase L1-like esterase